jgi:hypothetical protein
MDDTGVAKIAAELTLMAPGGMDHHRFDQGRVVDVLSQHEARKRHHIGTVVFGTQPACEQDADDQPAGRRQRLIENGDGAASSQPGETGEDRGRQPFDR